MGKKRNSRELLNERNIPSMADKTVVITGANSGIGFEAAKMMAAKGAHIIMACRNLEKSGEALQLVKRESPSGIAELYRLDLSDFSSIRSFVTELKRNHDHIDILVNNAGLMATPYSKTADGFEMQFGTNHLGHFLLTGMLLDMILSVKNSRIVTVTSIAHFTGEINFRDINYDSGYGRMIAYRQSKLANLLFAYELQRRLARSGRDTISVAVHPGVSATSIIDLPPLLDKVKDAVLMSAIRGALPTIMGATEPSLSGGEYIGPNGFRQAFGAPAILRSSKKSHDPELAEKLWDISEELTGYRYNF